MSIQSPSDFKGTYSQDFNESTNQVGITKNTLKMKRKVGLSPHESFFFFFFCSLNRIYIAVFFINILLVHAEGVFYVYLH